ncbi:DNA cytosine methyltransferase [Chenggangzhangella methanolivorans]|uniref:DNA cytosine methyltransferase n=1 Tax=Chenggangzhangella methanolivorans TaxID=1437009 RepID=A0A9E6R7F8_9HYPH|nr:DNA cytosine methyltransferase [Chenggangzhangella methanolivorans]QZN99602.1 DNA cytosine methyltransferase [Chenggangzhangella methanolivorans]
MLDYGSLFSGLETAAVAWHPLGWSTRFVSEVDATACAVLEERLPHVPNLGDVTAIDFDFRAVAAGSVDVVIGGSPCQSFSFAGDRSGLQDPRGMLALRYTEIIDATDPAVCVWENVEGALSTEGGRGFGALLGALSGHGGPLQPPTGSGWTDFGWVHGPRRNLAWRILDGRFFGRAARVRRARFRRGQVLDPTLTLIGSLPEREMSPVAVARVYRRSRSRGKPLPSALIAFLGPDPADTEA